MSTTEAREAGKPPTREEALRAAHWAMRSVLEGDDPYRSKEWIEDVEAAMKVIGEMWREERKTEQENYEFPPIEDNTPQ